VAVEAHGKRFLLGIAGPPGAGKTTLATELAELANDQRGEAFAVVAPLDGFHLPNATLDERGLRAVKGAPETFDCEGFRRSLARVREEHQTILWPAFHRERDEPTPDEIGISPETRLVVVEGNYLLLDRPCWQDVRSLLDDVWYVDAPAELLRRRLIDRAIAFGRTPEEATRHVDGSDMPNLQLVARTREHASRIVRTG
jgi:pantothenate kinase